MVRVAIASMNSVVTIAICTTCQCIKVSTAQIEIRHSSKVCTSCTSQVCISNISQECISSNSKACISRSCQVCISSSAPLRSNRIHGAQLRSGTLCSLLKTHNICINCSLRFAKCAAVVLCTAVLCKTRRSGAVLKMHNNMHQLLLLRKM